MMGLPSNLNRKYLFGLLPLSLVTYAANSAHATQIKNENIQTHATKSYLRKSDATPVRKPSMIAPGTFQLSARVDVNHVSPAGLQTFVADQQHDSMIFGFNAVFGYRWNSKWTAQLSIGRESYRHDGDGKLSTFVGRSQMVTNPVMAYFVRDIWTNYPLEQSTLETSGLKFLVQGAVGIGAGFGTYIYGTNDYYEVVQTERFTQLGGAGRAELVMGRWGSPVALGLFGGYRYFPSITLGSPKYEVSFSGVQLGFSTYWFL